MFYMFLALCVLCSLVKIITVMRQGMFTYIQYMTLCKGCFTHLKLG